MNEFLINMAFNVTFTLIGQFIKNPTSKDQYKKVMLKLHNAIKAAFAGDPDFQ